MMMIKIIGPGLTVGVLASLMAVLLALLMGPGTMRDLLIQGITLIGLVVVLGIAVAGCVQLVDGCARLVPLAARLVWRRR